MQIFINETSLNSQYDNQNTFFTSLKVFLSAIKFISELKQEKKVFRSDSFFYYTGIKGTHLETILKLNPNINSVFVANLQQVNPKSWEKEQQHEPTSSYICLESEYCSTSVAEISERKIVADDFQGFLLNFENSQFGSGLSIEVTKDNSVNVSIDCNINIDSIQNWLIENGVVNPEEVYDVTSGKVPTDYQTVLRDKAKFERTEYPRNNGRVVYRRIGTEELWVVDSSPKHAGVKAHLEVFDEKSRKHLGTSVYNEIKLNTAFKKANRYIDLG